MKLLQLSCLVLMLLQITGCAYLEVLPFLSNDEKQLNLRKQGRYQPDISKALFLLKSGPADNESHGMAMAIYGDSKYCYLITSNHLLPSTKTVTLNQWHYPSNKASAPVTIKATKYKEFPKIDMAVLRADRSNAKVRCQEKMSIAQSPRPKLQLYGYGNPINGAGTISAGIISSYWDVDKFGRLIVSDMLTTPGYSGGAVFSDRGRYIGMLLGTSSNSKYANFAYIVPAELILNALKTIEAQLVTLPK